MAFTVLEIVSLFIHCAYLLFVLFGFPNGYKYCLMPQYLFFFPHPLFSLVVDLSNILRDTTVP